MIKLTSKELKQKILGAQTLWGDGIIDIGKSFLENKDYIKKTETFIDSLYHFKNGKILFKPTKASNKQFRSNKSELISYFIGHNKVDNEDKGFALEPWRKIDFKNFDIISYEDVILSMGNYFFTDYNGNILKVEFSFGYIFYNNNLKITFHHSSLPYKS